MAPASSRPRVLLVDDDDDFRTLARPPIERAGFDLVEARNGREAFDYLVHSGERTPACIMLDMTMPVMTGWDLLKVRSIYARLSRIPVIVLSAQPPRLDEVGHPRPIAWLEKPTPWNVVIDVLKNYVQSAFE
jgi:CheY-like chemotaxis protein